MKPGLKRTTIPESILEAIAEDIISGRIKPGERLPPERDWSEKLGVSRHSLRQSIKILEALGMVESRPKTGTIVRSFDISNIMDVAGLVLRLSNPELPKVLEARRLLEGVIAGLASQNRTMDDLVEMEKHLDVLSCSSDLDTLIAEDAAFHLAISHATHNEILDGLVRIISGYLRDSVSTIRVVLYSRPEVNALLTKQHINIYEAVRSRNSVLASQYVTEHLLYAELQTMEQIDHLMGMKQKVVLDEKG